MGTGIVRGSGEVTRTGRPASEISRSLASPCLEWEQWLEDNHDRAPEGVWLRLLNKNAPEPGISHAEGVETAGYRLETAKTPETRLRRIKAMIEMFEWGEKFREYGSRCPTGVTAFVTWSANVEEALYPREGEESAEHQARLTQHDRLG